MAELTERKQALGIKDVLELMINSATFVAVLIGVVVEIVSLLK